MREFFQDWRRKVGLFALATALVLTVGWVRSYSQVFNAKVESFDGVVTIDTMSIPEGVAISGPRQHVSWRVPYWTIALPLAFLSPWMILGKPRKKQPPSTSDPRC